MKNFKVIDYQVVDKTGKTYTGYETFGKITRKVARAYKNYLNTVFPEVAPFRIAEVRITK